VKKSSMIKFKIFFCFIAVLLIVKPGIGQNDSISKWYWSVGTDVRQCFRTLPPSARSASGFNLEIPSPFYPGSGGLFIGRLISKNMSLETGLFYEKKQYQTLFDSTIWPPFKISQRFVYGYMTCPLYLNYRIKINSWLNINPSIGLTADIPISGKDQFKRQALTPSVYYAPGSTISTNGYEVWGGGELNNEFSSSVISRVAFEFKIQLYSISAVPFYSYSYTNLDGTYLHLYVYGISFLITTHHVTSNHGKLIFFE
jgi:hypothetical protein